MGQFLNYEDISNQSIAKELDSAFVYQNQYGFSTVGIRVVPPTDSNLTIEGSFDGTNYFPTVLKDLEDGVYLNTFSSTKNLSGSIAGLPYLRFRVSSAGSDDGSIQGRAQVQQSTIEGIEKLTIDTQTNALIQRPATDLLDAFGRTRTATPQPIFEAAMTYDKRLLLFDETFSGSGTSTHDTNKSMVDLEVGTTSGDKVIRQTRRYFRYQVARTHMKTYAGILGAAKTGVVKRVGNFDSENGFFFQLDSSGLKIVRRHFLTGSLNEEVVTQGNFNIDNLDGTGPSGVNLDTNKFNIYGTKLNWHGGGPVSLGIFVNGRYTPCHEFLASNSLVTPLTSIPNLPLRYEIENTSDTASSTSMSQGASSVVIEGGAKIDQSVNFSFSNQSTTRSVGSSKLPLLVIRPKSTFRGKINRTLIAPVSFSLKSSADVLVEVILGASVSGGTWVDHSSSSTVEGNRTATSYSGGRIITSFYISSSQGSKTTSLLGLIPEDLFLSTGIDGQSLESLVLSIVAISGSGEATGALDWRESY